MLPHNGLLLSQLYHKKIKINYSAIKRNGTQTNILLITSQVNCKYSILQRKIDHEKVEILYSKITAGGEIP